jgi:hypothetical protein
MRERDDLEYIHNELTVRMVEQICLLSVTAEIGANYA